MGFGSMAIDDNIRNDGNKEGIVKVLRLLKDYSLEELLTSEDIRLRALAEFFVEREKVDCDANRLEQIIDTFIKAWINTQDNPLSKFGSISNRIAQQKGDRSMPTL